MVTAPGEAEECEEPIEVAEEAAAALLTPKGGILIFSRLPCIG